MADHVNAAVRRLISACDVNFITMEYLQSRYHPLAVYQMRFWYIDLLVVFFVWCSCEILEQMTVKLLHSTVVQDVVSFLSVIIHLWQFVLRSSIKNS